MKKRVFWLIVIFQVLFFLPLRAEEFNPLRKIARGVVNISLCYLEIPCQMIKMNKEKGDVAGLTWGFLKGLTFTVGRGILGAYEIVTFLLPSYKPLVEPEFVFPREEEDLYFKDLK